MMYYTIAQVKGAVELAAETLMASREQLEETDRKTGDGDLGISMYKGGQALLAETAAYSGQDIALFFGKCAMAFNKAAPSTMGTLISCGFMQAAKELKGKTELSGREVLHIPGMFAGAIARQGKAAEGDRTVLDALLPLCRELEKAEELGLPLREALEKGCAAAAAGEEKTKELVPKVGRAKWAPGNAAGTADGGAQLCVLVARAFLRGTERTEPGSETAEGKEHSGE